MTLAAKCPAGKLYGESFGTSLAVHLLKNFSIAGLKPNSAIFSFQKQKQVLDLIEAHLDTNVSLEDLARIAGISKFYFCHLFKQIVGIPPHQYIIRRRIERAKKLLKYSQLTTVEIALACGFVHQSHLTCQMKPLTLARGGRMRADCPLKRIVGIFPHQFHFS